jgi:redox-sensitive bicupin YhaK (pirin superfamily)
MNSGWVTFFEIALFIPLVRGAISDYAVAIVEKRRRHLMKKPAFIKRSNGSHWVGDGFPVRNIFSYDDIAEEMSPFLLIDYAGPREFSPTTQRRGVGEHPHRGFETVTIVYEGEVEHRDSSGGGGKIGPHDVQWMTAASGVVHDEYHGAEFAKRGGLFEMVQLWVNLPGKHKMDPPGYQAIAKDRIPHVELPEGAGVVRVIAGEYNGAKGPAHTFSPMNVWDLRLKAGHRLRFQVTEGWTTGLFVLRGKIQLLGEKSVGEAELAVFERDGDLLEFEVVEDATILFLNGEPLNEPIIGYGPFVMNTEAEIRQAFVDFQSGRMGRLGSGED